MDNVVSICWPTVIPLDDLNVNYFQTGSFENVNKRVQKNELAYTEESSLHFRLVIDQFLTSCESVHV